jgi:hypothetical protein
MTHDSPWCVINSVAEDDVVYALSSVGDVLGQLCEIIPFYSRENESELLYFPQ